MKMDSSHIDALLEKYWEGTSSLAEEAEIRSYFAHGDVAEEHKTYAPLFGYFAEARSMQTALDVEEVLSEVAKPKPRFKLFALTPFTMGIAAAMVALLSVITVMNVNTTSQKPNNTIVLDQEADAEEALRITKQALALLSKNINTSSENVQHGVQKVKAAGIMKY